MKRFHYFLKQRRDKRTLANLNLSSIEICFSGIGGRTVAKLRSFDLGRVRAFQPHVNTSRLNCTDNILRHEKSSNSDVYEQVSPGAL